MQSFKADSKAEYNRVLAPAVKKSLEAGLPVLAEHDHCFIVIATDNQEPPLLGYGTRGKSTLFENVIRMSCYPWALITFGEKTSDTTPEEVDLSSLKYILDLYHEKAQGRNAPETRFSGKQAWEEWLNLLREGHACDNNMLIHLRYNRKSAVSYLRDMAERYNGVTATQLSSAADIYQQILDRLMEQKLPWNRVFQNGEDASIVRAEYTTMIEKAAELEARAITELESAVRSMQP